MSIKIKKTSKIFLVQKLILIFFLFISCGFHSDNKIETIIKSKKYILYENFPSKFVENRNVEVFLPSGYDTLESCPVLYMFDGQNIFHGKKSWMSIEYSHGWQVDETIDSLNKLGNTSFDCSGSRKTGFRIHACKT